MKLPLEWIREYADIPMDAAQYERRMVMCGTGVEGVTYPEKALENIVVGRVLTCVAHENSDHLHVCTVDVGQDAPLQIVCGAPNVREGLLVPVALIGSAPSGHEIKKGKLRGVESFGMLCSGPELGIPQELYPSVGEAGLLVFREEYAPGTPVSKAFQLTGAVCDYEILANRPDCLCAWGIARETAAAMGTRCALPEITVHETPEAGRIEDYVRVSVEDIHGCPRYAARVVANVRIAPSPLWLRARLHMAGLRAINNIVDITNYVMLETGHPMHAFDLAKVRGGEIIVRRAKPGESLRTLDGKEHALTENNLLICDAEGPTGLAGIMGGEESEITEGTASVMFECAAFDRTVTRVASRALGVRTESSGRFERGVSPATITHALSRACQLVNLLDAGDIVPGEYDLYPNPQKPITVVASCKKIAHRAGVDIAPEEMEHILGALQFAVSREGDRLTATAPDFRQDIEGPADLCEEILRLHGYDDIPSTALRGDATPGGRSSRMTNEDAVRDVLTGLGYFETMSFSFVSMKSIQMLGLSENDNRLSPVMLRNPLGEDTACMRTTLAPSLLKALSGNMNRGVPSAMLYELSAIYDGSERTDENLPLEKRSLALGAYGADVDFYTLRGATELLCARFGVAVRVVPGGDAYYHPGRRARLLCGDTQIAQLGEIHPEIAERFELSDRTVIAEVDLCALFACAVPMGTVKSLARTPAVGRDIALVMPEEVLLGDVLAALREAGGVLLEDAALFDVYRGAQVGEGSKSAAFSLVFRAPDRTLTEEEVATRMEAIRKACKTRFGAEIRS